MTMDSLVPDDGSPIPSELKDLFSQAAQLHSSMSTQVRPCITMEAGTYARTLTYTTPLHELYTTTTLINPRSSRRAGLAVRPDATP